MQAHVFIDIRLELMGELPFRICEPDTDTVALVVDIGHRRDHVHWLVSQLGQRSRRQYGPSSFYC